MEIVPPGPTFRPPAGRRSRRPPRKSPLGPPFFKGGRRSHRPPSCPRIVRWAALLLLLTGCASEDPPPPLEAAADCTEISVHCGATPSLAFDGAGRLWAVFEQAGHVWLTASDDLGTTFTPAVQVNEDPETIETNGENRPKIAFGRGTPAGAIYVSWTKKVEGMFRGDIRFSRSLDGGRSFEPPRTVNDDRLVAGHRFDSLHVDAAGHVYVVWIDKRDLEAAKAQGEDYRGAAIYYAVSGDQGASFAANRRVADHACECCRIAVADAPQAGAAILWRHVFDTDTRDHAFAVLGADGMSSPMRRATWDGWHIDACPHHGPALLAAGGDGYHLAWFTAADERPVVYYAGFDPATGELSHQITIATGAVQAHPHLVAAGGRLLLVWKDLDGGAVNVYLKLSSDGGATWDGGRSVAATAGTSDHPFLLARGGDAFLSWHTAAEGLRVLPLVE